MIVYIYESPYITHKDFFFVSTCTSREDSRFDVYVIRARARALVITHPCCLRISTHNLMRMRENAAYIPSFPLPLLLRVFILSLKKVSLSKMAGGTSSVFCYCALAFYLFFLTGSNNGERFGDKPKTLHIVEDTGSLQSRKTIIFNKDSNNHDDNGETSYQRTRRSVESRILNNKPNITVKVRHFFFIFFSLFSTNEKIRFSVTDDIAFLLSSFTFFLSFPSFSLLFLRSFFLLH